MEVRERKEMGERKRQRKRVPGEMVAGERIALGAAALFSWCSHWTLLLHPRLATAEGHLFWLRLVPVK